LPPGASLKAAVEELERHMLQPTFRTALSAMSHF
jgi:hypothetical protein